MNLIEASRDGRLNAEVVRVVSDRPEAPVLERARALGVPTAILEPSAAGARLHPDAERRILEIVRADRIDLITLCGFMRLLGAELIDGVRAPILNVHPSLLPAFRGLHAQRRAVEAGVRVTGATVHFVDSGMDTGPILLQAPLEVLPGDTEESLSERLLPVEQRLYVEAVRLFQRGAVRREGRTVHIDSNPASPPATAETGRRK